MVEPISATILGVSGFIVGRYYESYFRKVESQQTDSGVPQAPSLDKTTNFAPTSVHTHIVKNNPTLVILPEHFKETSSTKTTKSDDKTISINDRTECVKEMVRDDINANNDTNENNSKNETPTISFVKKSNKIVKISPTEWSEAEIKTLQILKLVEQINNAPRLKSVDFKLLESKRTANNTNIRLVEELLQVKQKLRSRLK